MITKEQLKKRVLDLKKSWLDDDFEQNVDRIIDAELFDLEQFEDNYRLAHPIVAAILEKAIDRHIYGFSPEDVPWAKRAKNKARRVI